MERKETLSFQAQTKQLLDLMIHSIYTHKEIFLRELISNASDALDKLRFKALTESNLMNKDEELYIDLKIDSKAHTLTISDNGIGMTYEEVVNNIGTIANSGSKQFFDAIKEGDKENLELIGQFGVGFYSAFMAAKKVVLLTKSPFAETGVRWESSGDGSFIIEDYDKTNRGTKIILYLRNKKEEKDEFDYDQFTQQWSVENLVKKYSDFIRYPIKMEVENDEYPLDKDGNPDYKAKPTKKKEIKTLNSMKPLWQRDKKEIEENEYKEFYKHSFHDWNDPLEIIHTKAEGTIEFKALLYIPEKAPFDLYTPEYKKGLKLYSKNVFIMDRCEDLIPDHFKFVKGLVDSPDFSLNISREILQHNRQLKLISKNIEKKIQDTLEKMLAKKRDIYEKWFKDFGTIIKTGIYQDFSKENIKLKDLLLFESTNAEIGMTTLKEYVERMKEGQEKIYYTAGHDRKTLEKMPQMEAIQDKGYEVLFFLDNIDEFMVNNLDEYEGKKLESLLNAEFDEEKKQKVNDEAEAQKNLLESLKEILKDKVTEVRLTSKLKESPACLVSANQNMSLHMEQVLSEFDKMNFPKAQKVLEINPEHKIYHILKSSYEQDPKSEKIGEIANLLFDQATLAQGIMPDDPVEFSKKIADLMGKAF